jgi:hypothetical protein
MKKLFVHLSMLALLAALLVPMVGCNKDKETEVEETPATSAAAPAVTTPAMSSDMGGGAMSSDMGGGMGSDMGAGTATPMGSDMGKK